MDAIYAKCAKPAIYAELHQGLQPYVYWHVTESIQEGYAPDQVGELQEEVEVEALVLERRSIARDRALGYFISLLHYYLRQQSDSADLDAALSILGSTLEKEEDHASIDDFHLDTADIYEYVEEQKKNAGLIADDPAWHRQAKTSEKIQWNTLFKTALELTRTSYIEACKRFEHRFKMGSEADLALVQLLPANELIELLSKYKASPAHVPAPPQNIAASTSRSSFWGQRIGNNRANASAVLPEFDPAHLVKAGQQFRAACIERVRAQNDAASRPSEPGKDFIVILSQALNPETNPERLIQRASQRYDPSKPLESELEGSIRSAKDSLSSALLILGTRDGERNTSLRIDAYNLRGYINLRLAQLKPQHEANYLGRAVADWSASTELDLDQNDIMDILAKTEIRLESLPKLIEGPVEKEASSTDSNMSKKSLESESSTVSAASASTATPRQSTAEAAPKPNKSQPSTSSTNKSNDVEGAEPGKPREKTILESPFFRSDLVTGLMVDSLLALPFPHRAHRDILRFPSAAAVAAASQDHVPMLDRLAKSHHQTTKALTPENKAQLKVAIKCVSAVLALPDLQQTRDDSAEKVLQRTSLRLVLGTLHLLLNDFVKAQTELDLVSNALRPNVRQSNGSKGSKKGKETSTTSAEPAVQPAKPSKAAAASNPANEADPADDTIRQVQTRVQGQTLFLLAKTCWMSNKVQESVKFFRYFTKWYSEQQTLAVELAEGKDVADIELVDLDMGWWHRIVVAKK
ncbi:uncharacterized protein UTRI_04517_B [Ustilago trichophora]|uniref:Uncharacterized protein n=1 Tax=Ustilago trichophora TaxID=86804 RepID=A0A5C3EET7_9BASI|nr:uncharacterized protein UTRI_04517_B [Ustilago trichophora]